MIWNIPNNPVVKFKPQLNENSPTKRMFENCAPKIGIGANQIQIRIQFNNWNLGFRYEKFRRIQLSALKRQKSNCKNETKFWTESNRILKNGMQPDLNCEQIRHIFHFWYQTTWNHKKNFWKSETSALYRKLWII